MTKASSCWRSSRSLKQSSLSATSSCSRRVAVARHEERLHLPVLEHRRRRGAFILREREERLLRLRDHGARQVVLVNRVVARIRPI
jgi:hypothetical protein